MALTFGSGFGFRTLALLAAATTMALVATAGCGGSVIGVGPTGDDGGRIGDDGDDGGRIGDDGDDGGRVNPACPAADGTLNGMACRTSGLTCPSGVAERDCSGAIHDLECFCNGASWDCEVASVPDCVTPPPPPPLQCPAPSMLVPGQACRAVGLTCLSDNVPVSGCGGPSMPPPEEGKCTCGSRGWQCPVIALPCVSPPPPPPPPPSGTCPSPDQVYAYGPCYGYGEGLNCAGNPQVCEDETFYDAFQCEGEWIPVATTICADVMMDGGSADASF